VTIQRIAHQGIELAYQLRAGMDPVLVFLPGFGSDMAGTKALFLLDHCQAHGQAMLRLDYSGHGASGGEFTEGCIGRWAADAAAVIAAAVPRRRLMLVGSSMGGWIAAILARDLAAQIDGFVGIAVAPDFTEDLIRPALDAASLQALSRDRMIMIPNAYGPPTPITRRLLEDGAQQLVLRAPLAIEAPVRLIHGMRDAEVPFQTSLRLAEQITGANVRITLVKDGEHRLSRAEDLALLAQTCWPTVGEAVTD
jgi:pimeloyl-ACP methyl ester carboxylesterase